MSLTMHCSSTPEHPLHVAVTAAPYVVWGVSGPAAAAPAAAPAAAAITQSTADHEQLLLPQTIYYTATLQCKASYKSAVCEGPLPAPRCSLPRLQAEQVEWGQWLTFTNQEPNNSLLRLSVCRSVSLWRDGKHPVAPPATVTHPAAHHVTHVGLLLPLQRRWPVRFWMWPALVRMRLCGAVCMLCRWWGARGRPGETLPCMSSCWPPNAR